jgi:hypothetical protein
MDIARMTVVKAAKKVKRNNLLGLCFLILFASCGQIQIKTPSSRFISPEAAGKLLSGEVEIQQQGGAEGTIYINSTDIDNPMELRNNVTPLAFGFNLGLMDKVDFITYSYTDSAPLYGAKIQLMGKSRQEAKKGDQSLAVTLGYGEQYKSQSESRTELFTGDVEVKGADIKQTLKDISVIYGYRTADDVVVYTSVQLTQHEFHAEIESNDSAINGKHLNYQTTNLGAALGAIRYFKSMHAKLELSGQHVNWTLNDPATYAFLNIALGWYWD